MESKPYHRQANEPAIWFKRFQRYRDLGPRRTLAEAYRAAQEEDDAGRNGEQSAWQNKARTWRWKERAEAWDADNRSAIRARMEIRKFDSREERLRMIDALLRRVYSSLLAADIDGLSQDDARKSLPVLRGMFKELVMLQREELEATPAIQGEDEDMFADDVAPFTADELAQANRDVAAAYAPRTLLAITGPDAALSVDIAALRAVKNETGLDFQRIEAATKDDLESYLRRERNLGRPLRYLHIACHAGAEGIELADGIVDAQWLSQRLQGVRVLLLAGCKTSRIADLLFSIVPFVITVNEQIGHEDAALLTQHFWTAIAQAEHPSNALASALARCSPIVSELVIAHW